eukprot:1149815-Pelagomonas_calceolata.AAC.1
MSTNPHQQNVPRWKQHKQQDATAQQGSIRVQLQAAGMEQMRQKLMHFACQVGSCTSPSISSHACIRAAAGAAPLPL